MLYPPYNFSTEILLFVYTQMELAIRRDSLTIASASISVLLNKAFAAEYAKLPPEPIATKS